MSFAVQAVTNAPLDLAQEPEVGGDDIPVTVTVTIASPGVFTAPADYIPVNTNRVKLSTTGALPTGLTAGTTYYVVAASGRTFELSATSGGSAINTSGSQSGVHTAHLNSGEIASAIVPIPFKPEYTVVVSNTTAGSLVLQDSDDNVTYGTLATVAAGEYQKVQLRKRYIKVSTAATLYLLGN